MNVASRIETLVGVLFPSDSMKENRMVKTVEEIKINWKVRLCEYLAITIDLQMQIKKIRK